ncbi:hypothetical protein TRFO_05336 [Tritrichomonas foetus]|uniref:Uncharacterized protein n=1 Tax=Tritrichomonas foetus TaxID=1144522 RepID=A0A1J4K810_9EUKA|nr:hypothetical protein TRFO_05336 [Tritrichomonas foetus]|eukprot:OHT07106.1 hypothetical protein TRFO_05336 [Tritrichomonas foetus]
MWNDEEIINLPRTKKVFHVTSHRGEMYIIKPGSAFSYDKNNNNFNKVRKVANLSGKIDRVILSPCGAYSLHLPKISPLLAFHENSNNGHVFTIPLPNEICKISKSKDDEIYIKKALIPTGETCVLTKPHDRVKDIPFIFNLSCKPTSSFSQKVKGIAISENNHEIVLAYDKQIWVWQQYHEEIIGSGFWTNLTPSEEFNINPNAINGINIEKAYRKSCHGYMKYPQTFTLNNPNTSPAIPQNSAVAYQDLCIFDNPDEGVGICCMTILLPPCRPFDTLYLFNSICYFQQIYTPTFQRCDITLSVIEGYGAPCVWWSVDCRFAVLAVSNTLIILTRYLRIIRIIPLTAVFPYSHSNSDSILVAGVSWSCRGEYFVVTSFQGHIGLVTRCGKSLKHEICSLEVFDTKYFTPLLVTSDSYDPNLFNIYSPTTRKMRKLRINPKKIPRDLQIFMSLHFPQVSASKLWPITLEAIKQNGVADKIKFVRLLYYTGIFRIFPYKSPMRSYLIPLFEEGAKALLDAGDDIFAYFIVRCILRLTGHSTKAYMEIHERLSSSDDRKDHILFKILDDELNKRDYSKKEIPVHQNIKVYSLSASSKMDFILPHHSMNANIPQIVDTVINIIYHNDYNNLDQVNCNLKILADLLIHLDQPAKALIVAKHESVGYEPEDFFVKICTHYKDDAAKLFAALTVCIEVSPENEDNFRAICVKAITNILKQRIAESVPSRNTNEKEYISKLTILERELQIIIPKSKDQLDDFAVIFSIALCAANYQSCMNYLTQNQTKIPEYLREAVRKLFKLLWFIQWRFLAIHASAKSGYSKDALLRLFAFPEFFDVRAAKSQMNTFSQFSDDVYQLYMCNHPQVENDPYYSNYLESCARKINPTYFSKIATSVLSYCKIEKDIPYSGILISAIVSHMIPWLRCGIPRAIVKFKCYENVPNQLLQFEEYHFPPKIDKSLNKSYSSSSLSESSDSNSSSSFSEGEYNGSTKNKTIVKQLNPGDSNVDFDDNDRDKRISLSSQKMKIKRRRKHPKKAKKKLNGNTPPVFSVQKEIGEIPQQPQVFGPAELQQPIIAIPTPIYYPTMAPTVIHKPYETPEREVFCPIWDFSPEDFQAPTEEEEIKEEEPPLPPPPKPVYVNMSTDPVKYPSATKTVETQFEPPPPPRKVRPLVIMPKRKPFVPPPKEDPLNLSVSSTESEIYIPADICYADPNKEMDPFPLDDALPKKFENLIDDIKHIPDASDLPPKPVYSSSIRNIKIPQIADFQIDKSMYEIKNSEKEEYDYIEKLRKQEQRKPKEKTNIKPKMSNCAFQYKAKLAQEKENFKEFEDVFNPNFTESKERKKGDRKAKVAAKEISPDNMKKDKERQKRRTKLQEIEPE